MTKPRNEISYSMAIKGDTNSGKDALYNRFLENRYSDAYTPSGGKKDGLKKEASIDEMDTSIDLKVFVSEPMNTGGSKDRFGVDAILLVFDLTDPPALKRLTEQVDIIRKESPNTKIFLAGTKMDLVSKRVFDKEVVEAEARKLGLEGYIETSAKTGQNVQNISEMILKKIHPTKLMNVSEPILKEQKEIKFKDNELRHKLVDAIESYCENLKKEQMGMHPETGAHKIMTKRIKELEGLSKSLNLRDIPVIDQVKMMLQSTDRQPKKMNMFARMFSKSEKIIDNKKEPDRAFYTKLLDMANNAQTSTIQKRR